VAAEPESVSLPLNPDCLETQEWLKIKLTKHDREADTGQLFPEMAIAQQIRGKGVS
jgi:hypothetical protein